MHGKTQQEREKDLEDIRQTQDVSDLSLVHSEDDSTVNSIQEDESHASSLNDEDVQEVVSDDVHPGAEIIDAGKLGFTVNQYCETELLKILNDKHVPHGIYQDVLEWSRRAKRMKYSFEPARTKRSTQILHLTRWQAQQNRSPFQKDVSLPGNPILNVTVTCYNFKTELLSLLNSSVFTNCANLDVNPSNPFAKYQSPTGSLNCFNAAKWYATSYD